MLKGEKVILREVRRSDITNFLKWFNDPEVTQYLGPYLPLTEMFEQKYIEDMAVRSTTDVPMVIEAIGKEGPVPIGTIGLHRISPKDHEGTFGIGIGEKEYWSHGYGSEAALLMIKYGFEQVNLHRIASGVFSFNERSLRMHRKIGFKDEGVRREALFRNGRYWDMVEFGYLATEWRVK